MHKPVEQFSFTLPRTDKLKSKVDIDELFLDSIAQKAFPLKILINYFDEKESSNEFPKILVSVPKRKFKRAHDRNLLKRRVTEAYRLNKYIIKGQKIKSIGIIYVSNREEAFNIIQDKLILGLNRLKEQTT